MKHLKEALVHKHMDKEKNPFDKSENIYIVYPWTPEESKKLEKVMDISTIQPHELNKIDTAFIGLGKDFRKTPLTTHMECDIYVTPYKNVPDLYRNWCDTIDAIGSIEVFDKNPTTFEKIHSGKIKF